MVTKVSEEVVVNGVVIGELSAVIGGEGVPVVMTVLSEILIGYDNGVPVYSSDNDDLVEAQRIEFTKKIMKQHEVLKSLDL